MPDSRVLVPHVTILVLSAFWDHSRDVVRGEELLKGCAGEIRSLTVVSSGLVANEISVCLLPFTWNVRVD